MKDIYTTLSGSLAAWHHVEMVSNNVANMNTAGFREARMTFSTDGQMARPDGIFYNAADGALIVDDHPTHLALRGDGFFTMGNGSYSRDGNFRVDLKGNLVNTDDVPVLDDQGQPIVLQPGESIHVSPAGVVTGSQSGEVARLGVVTLTNPQPVGGTAWTGTPSTVWAVPPGEPPKVAVIQGALEHANADPMRGMVELIEASRIFEAQEKVIRTSDEMRARLNRIA